MTRTASCCCEACSITVEGEPVLNAICNCSSCRRRTGTAFGWSAYFPDTAVTAKTGETRIYHRDGAAGYDRHFCARCGTTLWWKSFGFLPEATGIAGGCFVEDPLPAPNLSAQDGDRCAWISLPENWLKA
ncbi:MAG TPA: GFA family protein [Rhizomicrobium sp.]|nr:GFA family protein [Rhizomicrobium sp.]